MPTNKKPYATDDAFFQQIDAIRVTTKEMTNIGFEVEAIAIDRERGSCIWIAEPERNDRYEWFHSLSPRKDQAKLYMDGFFCGNFYSIRVSWEVDADDFDNYDDDIDWEELS